jgi:hypothetical protein
VPIFIEMPFILKIWLKNVPENSVIFCQLILILTLMWQITVGTMASVTSVGNIKAFQIAVGAVEIFSLPLAYGLIKLRLPVYSVFVGLIFMEFIASGLRTWFAHVIAGLDIKDFFMKTWLRSMLSATIATICAFLVRSFLPVGFIRAILVCITSTLSITLLLRYFVLTSEEIEKIKEMMLPIYYRARRRLIAIVKIQVD